MHTFCSHLGLAPSRSALYTALIFSSSSVTPKHLMLNIFSLWRLYVHVCMKISLWSREGRGEIFSLLIILVIFRTKQKKKNPSLTAIHIHQQSQFMSFFSLLIWLFHVALTNHLPFQHCCFLVTQSCLTLSWPHGLQSTRLICPWDLPDTNTGVDSHSLFHLQC